METHSSNLAGYNALYYCVHFTEKETMTWSDQDTEPIKGGPELKAWGDQEGWQWSVPWTFSQIKGIRGMKIINEVGGSELDRKCGQVGAPWVRRGQPFLGSPFHQCHPAGRMGVRGRENGESKSVLRPDTRLELPPPRLPRTKTQWQSSLHIKWPGAQTLCQLKWKNVLEH